MGDGVSTRTQRIRPVTAYKLMFLHERQPIFESAVEADNPFAALDRARELSASFVEAINSTRRVYQRITVDEIERRVLAQ